MDEGEPERFLKKEEDSSIEYEYVDEDGNPIDTSRLDEYELVNETEEIEINSADETEIIPNSEKNIESYRPENNPTETPSYQEIKPKPQEIIQTKIPVQQTLSSSIPQVKTTQEIDTQHILQQAKLAQEQQKNTPIKKDSFDDNANEDMLRRLSMPGNQQQKEFVARYSQQEQPKPQPQIQQKKPDFDDDANAEMLRRLSVPGYQQRKEFMETYSSSTPKEQLKPQQQTKKVGFDNDANEEMLRKVSMSSKVMKGAEPVRDTSEDSKENPLVYKKGHPHLGMSFNMNTITNLTERLFNSDGGFRSPDPKKKKV